MRPLALSTYFRKKDVGRGPEENLPCDEKEVGGKKEEGLTDSTQVISVRGDGAFGLRRSRWEDSFGWRVPRGCAR
jgi:hypothetical protein